MTQPQREQLDRFLNLCTMSSFARFVSAEICPNGLLKIVTEYAPTPAKSYTDYIRKDGTHADVTYRVTCTVQGAVRELVRDYPTREEADHCADRWRASNSIGSYRAYVSEVLT